MVNVLIVDDEYYAREGVKRIVETHGGGRYQVTGEAEDAFSALEFIRARRPHIVLADIQMPLMDGIELAQAAAGYTSKFIIITGHDQFSYAKQAFKLDVVDFILKPVDPEELLAAMDRASSHIRRDSDAVKKQMIAYLRQETADPAVMAPLPWEQVQLALVQMEDPVGRPQGFSDFTETQQFLSERIEAYAGSPYGILHIHTDRVLALLDGTGDHRAFLKELQRKVRATNDIVVTVSLSHPSGAEALPDEYLRCKELMIDRFYQEEGSIIEQLHPAGDPVEVGEIETALDAIKKSVQAGDRKKALDGVKSLYRLFLERKCRFELIMESAVNLYLFMRNTLSAEAVSFRPLEDYNPVGHSLTLRRIMLSSLSLVEEGMILLRNHRSDNEDSAVTRAVSILNSRFCEDLTLESLAGEVFLNPSYLSRKLKEQLGMNFSKYLAKLRVEKAIALLRENYNVEEVARQVGYTSSRYFSDVFKAHTGHLPSKYKRK